jgi:nucleotide-binding universal stress UspA family protein
MSTIVVGADGSPGSIDALRYAIDEARVRGAEVKAVHAWHLPPAAYGSGWSVPVNVEDFHSVAKAQLDRSLDAVDAGHSGVTVTPLLGEGQAADVLCEVARDADLLVVGSRGYGGFRGLLLGSVSAQCAHHAHCPIVIVPSKNGSGANGHS